MSDTVSAHRRLAWSAETLFVIAVIAIAIIIGLIDAFYGFSAL